MSEVANPFAEAWQALQERDTVEPATRIFNLWGADATPFYVFVLRPNAAVARRLTELQQPMISAGIHQIIPPEFLHITVQSIGNLGAGGLTVPIADELADVVANAVATVAPFAVRLRGVSSFGSAVFAGVYEDDAMSPLHATQRAIVDALLDANRVVARHPERPYVPHLSLCYYDRAYATRQVIEVLTPSRDDDCGFMQVDALELVRVVGNGEPYPPMEVVRRIPLRGDA